MDFPWLEENLVRVKESIASARERAGARQNVRIVGVTKGHPVTAIRAAERAGLEEIGENRVHEAVEKRDIAGRSGMRWHLIGHLQSNKARLVPGTFDCVESVDSLKLATALDREGRKRLREGSIDVLLQVNVSGEEQKSGCRPEAAADLVGAIEDMDKLNAVGLMTMAPLTDDEKVLRDTFRRTRELRDELNRDFHLPDISMGMSGDFEIAVEEGATIVRLGTVLFGERPR